MAHSPSPKESALSGIKIDARLHDIPLTVSGFTTATTFTNPLLRFTCAAHGWLKSLQQAETSVVWDIDAAAGVEWKAN